VGRGFCWGEVVVSPWAALIAPVRAPIWHGRTRVHRLMDRKPGNQAKKWVPWTLLTPGMTLPTRGVIERCWAVLNQQLGDGS
jgi:hypothetical protein